MKSNLLKVISFFFAVLALTSATTTVTAKAIDQSNDDKASSSTHASSKTRNRLLRQRSLQEEERLCLLSTEEARFDTRNDGWNCLTAADRRSARCTYSCSCNGSAGDAPWCCGGSNHYCSNNQCVPLCSSTESPTSSPSEAPTVAPTPTPPVPENNECSQAQSIELKTLEEDTNAAASGGAATPGPWRFRERLGVQPKV